MAGAGTQSSGGTLFFDELTKSKNCIQRRPQFMAHAGEKFAFRLVRTLRLFFGGVQLALDAFPIGRVADYSHGQRSVVSLKRT